MAMLESMGKLGVWTWFDHLAMTEASELVERIEGWGYSALWIPEAVGKEPFSQIGYFAAKTTKLIFATGIANIYARDPMNMKSIQKTLADAAPRRFVLGLGVSHGHLVEGQRGHEYSNKPVSMMRDYLERMDKALYMGNEPEHDAPIVLAALRKNMLKLSASHGHGAHPYLVPPEHTAKAREILGKGPWLCPEQMVLNETDPAKARDICRSNLKIYLGLPNYKNNLLDLGFTEDDFKKGGSDKLVDAIVAWGDEQTIRDRIRAHWDAGADHVCVQAFRPDGKPGPDERLLESLSDLT